MNAIDLFTLNDLKAWIGSGASASTTDDVLMSRLITSMSQEVLRETNRSFLGGIQTISETRDGSGTATMVARVFPILSVNSISINGIPLNPSSNGYTPGYTFGPYSFKLIGSPAYQVGSGFAAPLWANGAGVFPRGRQNINFNYTAGYALTSVLQEFYTVPASGSPITITPNITGPNFANVSVQYFSGGTLTDVGNANPPSAGNYGFNPNTSQYYFAAGDAGRQIQITYNYGGVPFDLTQVLVEWGAQRYLHRKHIGIKSTSSKAGDNTSFDDEMPNYVKTVIKRCMGQPISS